MDKNIIQGDVKKNKVRGLNKVQKHVIVSFFFFSAWVFLQ